MTSFRNASVVLPDRILPTAGLIAENGRIAAVGEHITDGEDLGGKYLLPGFVDIHVHGGNHADFMDNTAEAFQTVCRCHLHHGTTSLTPTSTVATFAEYIRFLELCSQLRDTETGGARILGAHLYGPYFHPAAKGCHPNADFLTPEVEQDEKLLAFAGSGLVTLTVAPETPGTERLARAAKDRGLLVTCGHSYATFQQVEQSLNWGVSHVDHLFCAMSDRARLRQTQPFPMPAGVMEATLHFDELTTEVIADGWHLSAELLRFAYKIKGPDRLALVTDSMRAVDCPDGEYWFGPIGSGERIRRLGDVGVTLDGKSLASSVVGMDHCVRTFHRLTGAPFHEVVRMASLTPARILKRDSDFGSLEAGKYADLIIMDKTFHVERVYTSGNRMF